MSNPIILHPTITEKITQSQPPRFLFKPTYPGKTKRLDEIADAANAIASLAISEGELRILTAFAQALGVKLVKES